MPTHSIQPFSILNSPTHPLGRFYPLAGLLGACLLMATLNLHAQPMNTLDMGAQAMPLRPATPEDTRPVIRSAVPISPAGVPGGLPGAGAGSAAGPAGGGTDPLTGLPRSASETRQAELKPLGPNEFQKFVFESSGLALPLFGMDFFANSTQAGNPGSPANPFAPLINPPVTGDYPLGPGDEVLIRGWGSVDIEVRAVIDRNGFINIPRVGTVALAGVKAADAQRVIRAAIGKNFKDFELNVTFGQLRSITVYVVGQARRPGTYNLSSLSTLVSGLFASGGPSAEGSMRRIQLKRASQLVTEFDLYDFLSQGNKLADARLLDGDVIVIPPALGYVALTGKVSQPAVYEIKHASETLDQLLQLAGGLPVVADPRKAYLERITPGQSQPRSVEEFALDAQGLKRTLKKGDVLNVNSMVPEFVNAVTLRGSVSQPQRVPYVAGMRIRDLIPNKESLITRASVSRQNNALRSLNSVGDFGQQQAPYGQQQAGDSRATSLALATLAERMGDLIDEINLDYAVIERVNRSDLSVQLIPFNLGRVLANAQDPDNLLLSAGDIVTVFSANDVRLPYAKRRVHVRVEGEVVNPGVYQMAPGETLQNVLAKAGGLTKDAYLFGASFLREEVRKTQEENLQQLMRRLEAETASSLTQLSQSQGATSDTTGAATAQKLQAAQSAQRQALERLRSLRPTGRIALGLSPEVNASVAKVPSIRLQNKDQLVIPSKPDFVYVFGSVNTESALLHKPGRSVADYLEQSGLASGADRNNVILLRVDGSAITSSSAWGNNVMRAEVMPGDTIVMPEKVDRETAWSAFTRNTKDLTQIFFNLGLGAAALKTLRQ